MDEMTRKALGIDFLKVRQYYEWKNQGFKDGEILEMLGYSKYSQEVLTKWKRKNGVTMLRTGKREGRTLENFTVSEFISLKCKGVTHNEIARMYGIHYNTLDKWIIEQKKNGLLPNKALRRFDYKELLKSNV